MNLREEERILLKCLGFSLEQIPRYRDCFIGDNKICIYTRTGGGNREFYDNEKIRQESYKKYKYEIQLSEIYKGPWNDDLRNNPHYLYDGDREFDNTYAIFFFKFPNEYKNELEALEKEQKNIFKHF